MKIALLALAAVLSGCCTTGPYATQARVWVSADMNSQIVGKNPAGNLLVTQPLPFHMEAHYHHISSLVEKDDPGIIDSVGVGFCVKFPIRDCND